MFLAALGSLALLFTYGMPGTASVCAFYALFSVVNPRHLEDLELAGGRRARHGPPLAPPPAPATETTAQATGLTVAPAKAA